VTVRVLVVARGYPSYDAPGRGSFVADHVAALRASGADVVVASFETVQARGPQAQRAALADTAETHWRRTFGHPAVLTVGGRFGADGVPVARLPAVRTWGPVDGSEVPLMVERHRVPLVAFGEALAATGRRFDVVHAHNGLPDGVAAQALAGRLGLPLVVTEHDSTLPDRLRHPAPADAYRGLLASATVVAVSSALAARIEAALGASGDAASVHDVLPNTVPLDRFPAPNAADVRDRDELLWVGARAPHKGFETLLRAFALAHARQPGLRLRAIGPATTGDDERWHAVIDELDLAQAVSLEPAASRETVAEAMRRAGLFVHASPFETFGMVAAEALASGLPVAATPSGGVEGILAGDPARGEVAADTSAEALADAIDRLHSRVDRIDRAALRAGVETSYAPRVIAERTLSLYAGAGVTTSSSVELVAEVGDHAIAGAVVVGTHPSAVARVDGLPDGPLPVRLVRPPADRPTDPAASRRWLRRLTGHDRVTDPIGDAWRALGGDRAAGRVVLVPADVEDVEAIAEALGGVGAEHLAPGSLRWLGDVRDASAARMGR
jgi:glycosyltransferase involved in cell wall biosynthesis